jgi:hypothetical protein
MSIKIDKLIEKSKAYVAFIDNGKKIESFTNGSVESFKSIIEAMESFIAGFKSIFQEDSK